MKRRLNSQSSHSNVSRDRWLISYADLITLLFALFVVLYAMSKADQGKLKKVASGMTLAFHGERMQLESPHIEFNDSSNPVETKKPDPPEATSVPSQSQQSQYPLQMQSVREALEESLGVALGASSASRVEMEETPEGLKVRVLSREFFQNNSASVPEDLLPILDRVGRVLATTREKIRIEGHSAVNEALNPERLSPLRLSSERAENLAVHWVSRLGIDPTRISVSGRAQYDPLPGNENSSWSEKRVDIVVLRPQKTPTASPDRGNSR